MDEGHEVIIKFRPGGDIALEVDPDITAQQMFVASALLARQANVMIDTAMFKQDMEEASKPQIVRPS